MRGDVLALPQLCVWQPAQLQPVCDRKRQGECTLGTLLVAAVVAVLFIGMRSVVFPSFTFSAALLCSAVLSYKISNACCENSHTSARSRPVGRSMPDGAESLNGSRSC
jgi:hypothetical protein